MFSTLVGGLKLKRCEKITFVIPRPLKISFIYYLSEATGYQHHRLLHHWLVVRYQNNGFHVDCCCASRSDVMISLCKYKQLCKSPQIRRKLPWWQYFAIYQERHSYKSQQCREDRRTSGRVECQKEKVSCSHNPKKNKLENHFVVSIC